jgi:TPR repeat protein
MMYDNGYGVEQDNKKARKYYMLSVEKGYAGAQYNLGILYKLGNGVEQDYIAWHFLLDAATPIANEFKHAK